MSATTLVFLAIAGSALFAALMLVVFGLFLRTHFTRLLRESERRIYRQLNGEEGLRPRLEKLEREHARLLEAREDLRQQAKELEKQKRAAFALTQIAKGLTQTSTRNLERVQELERRIDDLRVPKP